MVVLWMPTVAVSAWQNLKAIICIQYQLHYSYTIVNAVGERWISDQNAWIPVSWKILNSKRENLRQRCKLAPGLTWWHGSDGEEALLYSYPVSESWGAKRQTGCLKASLQKDITKWSKWINLVRYTFLCSPKYNSRTFPLNSPQWCTPVIF